MVAVDIKTVRVVDTDGNYRERKRTVKSLRHPNGAVWASFGELFLKRAYQLGKSGECTGTEKQTEHRDVFNPH